MRALLLFAIIAVGVAAVSARSQAADQTLHLAPGQQDVVELQENPSTGYSWQIDAAGSTNLSMLRIADRGFSRNTASGKPLLGAPGTHRWSVEALTAGEAHIVFSYRRPWEAAAIRRHEVAIVSPGQ